VSPSPFAPQPYTPPASPFASTPSSPSTYGQEQADRIRQSTADMFQRVPVCSNCRKQVTEEESKRSTCPHCGARWIFNTYNPSATDGTSSGPKRSPLSSLSSTASERAVRTTILVVGAIVVVVVLCGGAIAVALALASASRPAQRYRI
jgi:DNA-directed RNA polymerase subunit RPC12/RpoP